MLKYERKLMKFWIQSFLLGVPKIIVGFRDKNGILRRLEELETRSIPNLVKTKGKGTWDGNTCINFAANFLECENTAIINMIEDLRLTAVRAKRNYHGRWGLEDSSEGKIAGD